MDEGKSICSICAWRKDCLKKYSFDSSGPTQCAEYTRDVTLPRDNDDQDQ